jgi:hypothetical protein
MTIFERETLVLLREIRDLLLKINPLPAAKIAPEAPKLASETAPESPEIGPEIPPGPALPAAKPVVRTRVES